VPKGDQKMRKEVQLREKKERNGRVVSE